MHDQGIAGRARPEPRFSDGELQDLIAEFVRRRVMPCEPVLDAGGPHAASTLRQLQDRAKQEGLWALPHPVELGGQGSPSPGTRGSPRPKGPATTDRRPWAPPRSWTR